MSSNNVNKYWKRRESITHILNSRHIAEANVWDKVDKWDSSYLSDLHWATIPSHKPCRWTHLAHTHSLCRQCRSSSNWLPLSVWPITQGYFICFKFSFSRKPFFSQMRTCFHTVIFFLKTNFPPPNCTYWGTSNTWIEVYLTALEFRCEFQFIPCWIWRLFNNHFFYKGN